METRVQVPPDVEEVITGWNSQAREAALKTIARYGRPAEVLPSALVWENTVPWKRIIVNRDTVPHRFPKPHNDLLEEWVTYSVPPDKVRSARSRFSHLLVELLSLTLPLVAPEAIQGKRCQTGRRTTTGDRAGNLGREMR